MNHPDYADENCTYYHKPEQGDTAYCSNTKKGDVIRFGNVTQHHEHQYSIDKGAVVGGNFTVSKVHWGDSHTELEFVEINGRHNSVLFFHP